MDPLKLDQRCVEPRSYPSRSSTSSVPLKTESSNTVSPYSSRPVQTSSDPQQVWQLDHTPYASPAPSDRQIHTSSTGDFIIPPLPALFASVEQPHHNKSQSETSTTLFQRHSATHQAASPPTTPGRSEPIAAMSAAAIHFDNRFDMGPSRSNFAWPVLESNADIMNHDMSMSQSSDPGVSGRSYTGSPSPRGILNPEHREYRRQRDLVRRDTKTTMRSRLAYSSRSPPLTTSNYSAPSLPVYSSAPSQVTLPSAPVTSCGSYLTSYATSSLPDQGHSLYSSSFSPMTSSGYVGMEYQSGFPSSPGPAGHPHYSSRPSPLSDSSPIYPSTAILPSGGHETSHVRVVQGRPKPQCWEHGCNGRQFSTFSNLLRHQREKSGQATKATCPNCGAEFTRTTARNGHLAHDKCKRKGT